MDRRVLIRGGCVLTLGSRTPNLARGDVLVEEGRVAEVGPRVRTRGAAEIDASGCVVMPGFVDAHRHVWRALFRNAGAGGCDGAWDASAYARSLEPDDLHAATLLGLLGAAEAGTTTVVDWCDVPADERYVEAALQAHADAGLRTVLVHAVPSWARDGLEGSLLPRVLDGRAVAGPGLNTVAAGSRDPTPAEVDDVAVEWAAARRLGVRIHAHAGVTAEERGVVAELGRRGLLGADVTLVHGTYLGDDDLDAVARDGAAVVSAPAAEMASGRGLPPMQALLDRGIRPGLGVDSEVVAPADLFTQMRAAQSVQHASLFDLKLAGKGGIPNLLTTRDVIRYATSDGARAAGLGDVTGSLEPGKHADVLVLRADRPNIAPVNDPIGAVVWGMDPSNVEAVLVGGRPLVLGGVLQADVQAVRARAVAARERVDAAAGPLVEATPGGPS